MKKKLLVLIIIIFGGIFWFFVGYWIWYSFQPEYFIYPEASKYEVTGEGDEIEIKINTDAPYGKWNAYSSYNWINIIKKSDCIIVQCKENDENHKDRIRTGTIRLRCSDRENTSERIEIIQPESHNIARGEITEIWITKEEYGMTIHVDFNVRYMDYTKGCCVAWFYHSNGDAIVSSNEYYTNNEKHLCVSERFTPNKDEQKYKDFQLYIPYEAFCFTKSEKDLNIEIALRENSDDDWRTFARKEYESFEITNKEIKERDIEEDLIGE